jgi:hypothetical protein
MGESKLSNQSKTPRDILEENILKGRVAEEIAKQDYIDHGFKITETGIGSDFIAEKKLGKSTYQIYVDVKSGKSKLSKKQKQTKNQLKKQNIPYDEYRITDEYLEFQTKNNLKSHDFDAQSDFNISQFTGIFVIHDPTSCPNCGLGANGFDEILTNFGLRNMNNGSVRVQSWCRSCRNYSRRGRK